MDIDDGILSNLDQLPVTQLNYGESDNRFSWILYKLGYLACSGKASTAVYPSELEDVDYYFRYKKTEYVQKRS